MALDFPSSPTNGQVFGNYTYDATAGGWRSSSLLSFAGVPAGGATNTVLIKNSGTDYDTSWTASPSLTNLTVTGTVTAADITLSGNLTVNGTTTIINSTTLTVDDINIDLGSVAIPSDTTANGGGITLKGATDKTIIWDNTNANWTASENWNIATGKTFKINNTTVLSNSALGSGVTGSSLTSVGTITSGTWNGSVVAVSYGGTGTGTAGITAFNNITGYTAAGATGTTSTSLVFSASPTFTGTPASTTAAVDTNTTQIATTAFVLAQASAATPVINGTAAVGTSTRYARADHVHPTDTTRSPLAGSSSITTVGTIASGTWNGGTIAVAYGGTGTGTAGIAAFNNITGYTASGATGTTSTNLVFSTSPSLTTPAIGAATGTSLAVTGALTSSGTAGVGYATGAGGTTAQLTSRTTGVTLSKISGQITLFSTTTTAGQITTFTVTNTLVAATDVVVLAHQSGGVAGSYIYWVDAVAAGSFNISIYTPTAQTVAAAPVFNVVIIKAVAA